MGFRLFLCRRNAELGAVFGRGDAVESAEALYKAAVIRKAAGGAGIKHTHAGGKGVAAVLHPQVGQIAVDALEGVFFEHAGQMLPAGVGVARQLCNIQLGICVVRLQVGNRLGNQQACGGGRRPWITWQNSKISSVTSQHWTAERIGSSR